MRTISTAATLLVVLLVSQSGCTHPSLQMGSQGRAERAMKSQKAEAFVGEPQARFRTATGQQGLAPLAFARWLAANPKLARVEGVKFRRISGTTNLLNHSATLFAEADLNGDLRISAAELADFVAGAVEERRAERTT